MYELGWQEAARSRDFLLRLRVGTLLHAPDFDPRLATPYRMVVGEKGPDARGPQWLRRGAGTGTVAASARADRSCWVGISKKDTVAARHHFPSLECGDSSPLSFALETREAYPSATATGNHRKKSGDESPHSA